jgi:hypothetical protein
MRLFKLTDEKNRTFNRITWGENITIELAPVDNPKLCTKSVLHAYKSPELAILLNPLHAGIKNPILWEAEGDICVEDWGKVGCFTLTTIRKIPIPKVNLALFARKCAEAALDIYEPAHPTNDWPRKVIMAARAAANADDTARTAARTAYAADTAADVAANAARAAADAADAARVAARVAADTARAAADAARAAADAARTANKNIDFNALAAECV